MDQRTCRIVGIATSLSYSWHYILGACANFDERKEAFPILSNCQDGMPPSAVPTIPCQNLWVPVLEESRTLCYERDTEVLLSKSLSLGLAVCGSVPVAVDLVAGEVDRWSFAVRLIVQTLVLRMAPRIDLSSSLRTLAVLHFLSLEVSCFGGILLIVVSIFLYRWYHSLPLKD